MSVIAYPSPAQWSETRNSGAAVEAVLVYPHETSPGIYGFTEDPAEQTGILTTHWNGGLYYTEDFTKPAAVIKRIGANYLFTYIPPTPPMPTLADITTGVVWVNADDLNGVVTLNNPVATLPGRIGGRNGTQATAGYRPLYTQVGGVNTIYGDGADDFLDFGNLSSLFTNGKGTVAISFRADSTPGSDSGGLMTVNNPGVDTWSFYPGGATQPPANSMDPYWGPFRATRINATPSSTKMKQDDTWHVLQIRSGTGAGSYRIKLDGVETEVANPDWNAPTAATLLGEAIIGGTPPNGKFFKGHVHEWFIATDSVSDEDSALIDQLMMAEVGL